MDEQILAIILRDTDTDTLRSHVHPYEEILSSHFVAWTGKSTSFKIWCLSSAGCHFCYTYWVFNQNKISMSFKVRHNPSCYHQMNVITCN